MSRQQRARIERNGPGDIPRPNGVTAPEGSTTLGMIRRGAEEGWLVRLKSGRYALQRGDGGLSVLDQAKVAAMLAREEGA